MAGQLMQKLNVKTYMILFGFFVWTCDACLCLFLDIDVKPRPVEPLPYELNAFTFIFWDKNLLSLRMYPSRGDREYIGYPSTSEIPKNIYKGTWRTDVLLKTFCWSLYLTTGKLFLKSLSFTTRNFCALRRKFDLVEEKLIGRRPVEIYVRIAWYSAFCIPMCSWLLGCCCFFLLDFSQGSASWRFSKRNEIT